MQSVIYTDIHFSLLESAQGFLDMREEWNGLVEKSGKNNIFLTWEWLYNWWDAYSKDRALFILIAKKNDELVGIFPLVKKGVIYYKCLSFRRLEFISTGEGASEEACPFVMSIICHPDLEHSISKGFVKYLVNELEDKWDELLLLPLLKQGKDAEVFTSIKENTRYSTYTETIWIGIYTELLGSWSELLQKFGRKTRKKIRKGRRVLEGKDHFSYTFLEDGVDLPDFFEQFVKLHLFRWDGGGAFSNKKFCSFQKSVCNAFFEKGWLRGSLMYVDEQVVSGNLDYQFGDTVFGYQTAFDPEFEPKLSIGLVGMSYCLEDAIKHNYRIYDWYREAGTTDYKRHFNTFSKEIVSIQCRKKSLRHQVFYTTQRIECVLKNMVKRLLRR